MIRKATQLEIARLIEITRACATKMASDGIYQWNDHYPDNKAFLKDFYRKELYVLLNKNRVIGCITISTLKDKEYDAIDWLTKDNKNFYIHRLAVHPDFQHRGNAKKLMDFAETFAKTQRANSIRLDTFSKNKRNNIFYENRGYKKLGNLYFPNQSEYSFHCYELVLQ